VGFMVWVCVVMLWFLSCFVIMSIVSCAIISIIGGFGVSSGV